MNSNKIPINQFTPVAVMSSGSNDSDEQRKYTPHSNSLQTLQGSTFGLKNQVLNIVDSGTDSPKL